MLKTLKKDNGLVLVVVLMVIIVMTTFTLSLLSLNISQVQLAQKEVENMQSEFISSGWMYLMFTKLQSGISGSSMQDTMTMGPTPFSVNVTSTGISGDSLALNSINSIVSF